VGRGIGYSTSELAKPSCFSERSGKFTVGGQSATLPERRVFPNGLAMSALQRAVLVPEMQLVADRARPLESDQRATLATQ